VSFIQDFLPVIKQLSYLQKLKQNLFVVVNEYGNILGIASATDMVELVFGDFTTDVADKKDLVIRKSEYEFIVDGAMLIREFNELYQQNLPVEFDALTVNGLIVKFLRMIPSNGTCFRIDNTVFEILQAGNFGVERVRLIMKEVVV
jgi:putative hemolysin